MPWWHAVAECDHELQNPTSREKIVLLGESLRLTAQSHVLDIACGKGGPAIILAHEFGCRITGVERAPEFVRAARKGVAHAGLDDRIEVVEHEATTFELEAERYDVVLCLGATFIWRDLSGTLEALTPAVRPSGHAAIGEVYLHKRIPDGVRGYEAFVSLSETAARFADAGLELTAFIASSSDDWDRYESLHWRAVDDWLEASPNDPDAEEFRRRNETYRRDYFEWSRETLGWGIFVARKR